MSKSGKGIRMEWLVLVFSLAVVTAGAEGLVRGASLLALRMGVSHLFVGLTIVGFGTSSPELAASVVATMRGSIGISVGNVIGSNIFNIGVIVGISALMHPIRIRLRVIRRDFMIAIAAATAPWIALAFGGALPRGAGVLFVAVLIAYILGAYLSDRTVARRDVRLAEDELVNTITIPKADSRVVESMWVNVILVVGGLILLIIGSRVFVSSAMALGRAAGVSELLIGLTIVSAGTSLPELMTSIVASARRNPDIAVGNIIGSNIFNVFGILGVSAIIRPQSLTYQVIAVDVPVMLLATLALVPIVRTQGIISRREGVILLAGYGGYLALLLLRGG